MAVVEIFRGRSPPYLGVPDTHFTKTLGLRMALTMGDGFPGNRMAGETSHISFYV